MKKSIIRLSSALMIVAIAFTSCTKKPEANFTAAPTTVQPGEPVIFTDGVSERKNSTITYDFGDGSSSGANEQNVSHVYVLPGTYTATQNIISNKNANTGKGKYATSSTSIKVEGAKAAFTSSSASPKIGETVTFTNTTTNGDKGFPLTYSWWMVDATGTVTGLGSTKNAWMTFGTNGTWTVYMEVWQGGWHHSTASDVITVGTGEGSFSTLSKMMATWNFVTDVSNATISGSTGGFGCPVNGTTTSNMNNTVVKMTVDVNGDIWVVRTDGFDQVKGDYEGTITIDMSNNDIATISGFTWGGTYNIKTLSGSSLVLESKIIFPSGCSSITTTVRTLTWSK